VNGTLRVRVWRRGSHRTAPTQRGDPSSASHFVTRDITSQCRGRLSSSWIYDPHHPHHRPSRPDVTGPPARFPNFLPTTPIALSGSRRSECPSVSGAGWPFRHRPARSLDPPSQTRERGSPVTMPRAGRFGHAASQRKGPPRLRGGPCFASKLPGRNGFKPEARYPRPSSAVSACRYAW